RRQRSFQCLAVLQRAHHHDRRQRRAGQFCQRRPALHNRHAQVHHHHIRLPLARQGDRLCSILRHPDHHMPQMNQRSTQQLRRLRPPVCALILGNHHLPTFAHAKRVCMRAGAAPVTLGQRAHATTSSNRKRTSAHVQPSRRSSVNRPCKSFSTSVRTRFNPNPGSSCTGSPFPLSRTSSHTSAPVRLTSHHSIGLGTGSGATSPWRSAFVASSFKTSASVVVCRAATRIGSPCTSISTCIPGGTRVRVVSRSTCRPNSTRFTRASPDCA